MAEIIDGKKISKEILEKLKAQTQEEYRKTQKRPGLAVILANDNPSSKIYVKSKEKCSLYLNYKSYVYKFDRSITNGKLISLIHELNQNPEVNGILVQLPLYSHLNEQEILEVIDPKKDVDGFHPVNIGRLNCGLEPYSICCTPKGIIKLLKAYSINLKGANVLVVGRSNIVGKPLSTLLTLEDATVTLAHSKTKNLKSIAKTMDIVISATGQQKIITADMVKKDAVVVDVGIIKQDDGHLVGDVDFEKVKNVASYITPVPGGVGPMTIACLMENTFELFLKQNF